MRPKPLPSFLLAPWHVENRVRRRSSKAQRIKRPARKKLGKAREKLPSVWHLRAEVITMARRLLNEHRLSDWGIDVDPLCVSKFADLYEPPHRHLGVSERIGTCHFSEKKIVIGIHPDLAELD